MFLYFMETKFTILLLTEKKNLKLKRERVHFAVHYYAFVHVPWHNLHTYSPVNGKIRRCREL